MLLRPIQVHGRVVLSRVFTEKCIVQANDRWHVVKGGRSNVQHRDGQNALVAMHAAGGSMETIPQSTAAVMISCVTM